MRALPPAAVGERRPDLLLMTVSGVRRWTRCCRMPSVPTTSLDLTRGPSVVADPYPSFAERARRGTRSPGTSRRARWLAFDARRRRAPCCATAGSAGSGATGSRPTYLEPFNLLHRNQMMENEPPEHTRLRRPVAGGVQPRARRAAAAAGPRARGRAARRGRPATASTCSGTYAEPLPVLVIAELLGVPAVARRTPARLVAGDRADVRAVARRRRSSTRRSRAASDFADLVRELVARPARDARATT